MKFSVVLLVISSLFFSFCRNNNDNNLNSLVPEPVLITESTGFFQYKNKTKFMYDRENDSLSGIVNQFNKNVDDYYNIKGNPDTNNPFSSRIAINVDRSMDLPAEGYLLKIKRNKIDLIAPTYIGVFYGLQSLTQLIHLNKTESDEIKIPVMSVRDYPRFEWRGMHLDVARHFIPVEDVKKYLDYMALYKFNKFHWHLTDDQGWRVEIEKYPNLTKTGAWRKETLIGHHHDKPRTYDGKKHGGYYTREELKDIVQYASDRFIEVIPEIEMPGHARAAIASYPWLGVTGNEIEVKKEWGISPYIFKPSEETFVFLENVLSEVIEIFPSEYIHIGGDEAHKDQWEESEEVQSLIAKLGIQDEKELQSWFIKRIEEFLNQKGKKLIGWDEILEGGLAPNATVMSWRGEEGGIKASKMGHDVIMTPTSHCYFDYYQSKPTEEEPLAIGGYLPLEKVYSYDPVPEALNDKEAGHILGAQANVWTEYIPDMKQIEYMIFPRMLAMSEVTWSLPENKNMDNFMARVNHHEKIFKALGVNYSLPGMPED